jgi:four helix bundle protein
MNTVMRFEDLEVWQKARELTKFIYQITKGEEFNRDIRLKYQMRDASVSIMSNIAEGFSRKSDKEFSHFLFISKGSSSELLSHSYVSMDQSYFSEVQFRQLYEKLDHVSRMLSNLIKYLDKK